MRLGYGFTLIELILALSLSLVVLSAAMLMLPAALRCGNETLCYHATTWLICPQVK